MRRIVQIDDNGCGAACVAIIAGITYRQAVERLGSLENPTSDGQIRAALHSFGITLGGRIDTLLQTFDDLKVDGLLEAEICEAPDRQGKSWVHWMVWDAEVQAVIDPTKDCIGSRRTRIVSFFPLSR